MMGDKTIKMQEQLHADQRLVYSGIQPAADAKLKVQEQHKHKFMPPWGCSQWLMFYGFLQLVTVFSC